MKFKLRIFSLITVIMLCLLTTGCLTKKYIERNQYLLNINVPKSTEHVSTKSPLFLYPIVVRAPFNQLSFLYRVSSDHYLTDYYNGFLISPGEQLYPVLKKFLINKGYFNLVNQTLDPNKIIRLRVEVTELYADYRDRKNPKALTSVNFFLSRNYQGREIILLDKTFSLAMPLRAKNTESLLAAWNNSFEILFLRGIHKINVLQKAWQFN
jgi:hypothetical protein